MGEQGPNAPMNQIQSNIIVEFMKNHSALTARQLLGNSGAENRAFQLKKLKDTVNKYGPPKTVAQVENHWVRLRQSAKEYNAEKKIYQRLTGNPTDKALIADNKLEKVLNIVGTSHNNGLELRPELGLPNVKVKRVRAPQLPLTPNQRSLKGAVKILKQNSRSQQAKSGSVNCVPSSSALPKPSTIISGVLKQNQSFNINKQVTISQPFPLTTSFTTSSGTRNLQGSSFGSLASSAKSPATTVRINSNNQMQSLLKKNIKLEKPVFSDRISDDEDDVRRICKDIGIDIVNDKKETTFCTKENKVIMKKKISRARPKIQNFYNDGNSMAKSTEYSQYSKLWQKRKNLQVELTDAMRENTESFNAVGSELKDLNELKRKEIQWKEEYYRKKFKKMNQNPDLE